MTNLKRNKWYRIVTVVWMMLGFFIQIFWYQKRNKTETEWDFLWKKIGQKYKQKMYELEGLLIKVGQLLSVRRDLLPESFIEEIKDLVDQVPPSSWEEVQMVLEAEWGGSYDERLKLIEKSPIASASIGEVYKAELNNGTTVVIKIQRPSIERIIKADFQALAIITWCAKVFSPAARKMVNFNQLYREIRQVIERELDFQQEMHTAIAFKQRFQQLDDVYIPAVFPEHCTAKVLVMEWVEASHITDPPVELDRKELSRKLLRIFLPQWLEEGKFHADPHAGNVLVNAAGQIVLLDFGMVGDITKQDAKSLQQLIEGIIVKDYTKAIQIFAKLGFLLPSADLKEMEQLLTEVLMIDISEFKKMDMLTMQKEINEVVRAHPIQVPTRFIFLGRSVATVQGIIQSLCPNEDILELGKPVFLEWLEGSGSNKWKVLSQGLFALPFVKTVQEIPDLLQEPRKMREWKIEEQRRSFLFKRYESAKKYAFILGLFNALFAYIGILARHTFLIQLSFSFLAAAALWYVFGTWRQWKWMKQCYKK